MPDKIKRPRVTPEELETARRLAGRVEGCTAAQLCEALSLPLRERARLIFSRLEGLTAERAGTEAGRASRTLVYRLGPPPRPCRAAIDMAEPPPGCLGAIPRERDRQAEYCSNRCMIRHVQRRWKAKKRAEKAAAGA